MRGGSFKLDVPYFILIVVLKKRKHPRMNAVHFVSDEFAKTR